ncbi:DUF3558 domain-containing protein [Nocardia sp. NPDC058666]|uniref:DUF3558 domain-containing protein n=1 Tax=unclassified Nocardia TaxID=2637762 RepID=UPI00366A153B
MWSWRNAIPALAAVGVLVGGCSDPELTRTAQSSTTVAATTSVDADASLWDPCLLADSAVSAAGLNTSTKEKDVAGVDFEDWKVCGWDDAKKTYSLTVYSTNHTPAELRQRSDRGEFVDTKLGDRPALQYRTLGSSRDYSCSIATDASFGLIDFDVLVRHSARDKVPDPCAEVRRVAEALVSGLPK